MADFGKVAEQQIKDNFGANPQELRDKANEAVQGVKERLGGAYDAASEWMEDNSITLFAIGGGILVAGLLTYFVATRKKSAELDVKTEQAA